jgi:hypothetical protein
MIDITEKQSRQLDLILKTLIKQENTVFELETIQKEVLPNESIDECRILFHKLNNHYPSLLSPDSGPTENSFWANDYAKAFMSEGGFGAIFDSEIVHRKKAEEIDQLNFEKLRYDVKNAKRIFKTYWWTFFIALLAFLISLYNFIQGLL